MKQIETKHIWTWYFLYYIIHYGYQQLQFSPQKIIALKLSSDN